MPNLRNYESHDFYCLNCGKKNTSILRPRAKRREKNHRKALYCPFCCNTVNHIECQNDIEVFNFKKAFDEGLYKTEAKESIEFMKQEEGKLEWNKIST